MNAVNITKKIARYAKDKAVNLSAMSRASGISYGVLYASLGDKSRDRQLTVDEAVLICKYLGKKVEDFVDNSGEKGV